MVGGRSPPQFTERWSHTEDWHLPGVRLHCHMGFVATNFDQSAEIGWMIFNVWESLSCQKKPKSSVLWFPFGPLITCEGNKASTSDVLSAKVVCLADKFCITFFTHPVTYKYGYTCINMCGTCCGQMNGSRTNQNRPEHTWTTANTPHTSRVSKSMRDAIVY